MDSVDKVIWVLPFFAALDVASTFYLESLGYPLQLYERGFFASLAIDAGLAFTYLYVVVYLLIIFGVSYFMWYAKNRKLDRSRTVDKLVFLLLVGVTCYVYVKLVVAFIINFFLPYLVNRANVSLFWLSIVVAASSLLSIGYYMARDVLGWVRSDGESKL